MICYCIGLVASLILRASLVLENKRRDKNIASMELQCEQYVNPNDKTDKELPHFKYVY